MPADHIVICFHDFSRGGTERIAIGMAHYWVDAGRRVTILCGSVVGGLRATVDPRIDVVELHPPITRNPVSRLYLARAMAQPLAQLAPDIVFLPGNFHLPLAWTLRSRLPHLPIVAKISNPPIPSGLLGAPVRLLLRRFSHRIDAVAVMNSGLEHEVRALAPHLPVRTLYDPIYVRHDIANDATARTDARFNVLWAGRFEPQKDVGLALRTIQALNRLTPARLTLLGDGSQYAATLRQISRMGLADCVAAPGHVPGIDADLAQADVLLVTSQYEGGPAVAVEALAHGVRVVSTDCSYFLRDIMTTAAAGAIVAGRNPADLAAALLSVSQTPAPPRADLAALVSHLDAATCAQAYLDWLDEAVLRRTQGNRA